MINGRRKDPRVETPRTKGGEDRWSYSQLRRLVQEILATKGIIPACVRIWHKSGSDVRIGMAFGSKKTILGGGPSFREAFENVFIKPLEARERALEAEGVEPLVASEGTE